MFEKKKVKKDANKKDMRSLYFREGFVPKRKIQLTKSPHISPVFFVLKKNGKKRMV